MKRNMLENHPKMEKQKHTAFFSQNETIIFKTQTITIKEQRLKPVDMDCNFRPKNGARSGSRFGAPFFVYDPGRWMRSREL